MTRSLTILALCTTIALPAVALGSAPPATPGRTALSDADLKRLVASISREQGVDPKLVDALVRVESAYNPNAVSRVGAMGLMQLMPDTATRLDVGNPFDPEENVRAGVREFSRLIERYSGNLQLALAAYNAGEGAVAQYRGVPPYPETRNYVTKIMTIYTGKPYRLPGGYRTGRPVRMVQGRNGSTLITNQTGAASASSQVPVLDDGPLRGGFGAR